MKNNEQMSPEERLLKAIFGKEWKPKSKAVDEEDEAEDNYPDTNAEKDRLCSVLTYKVVRVYITCTSKADEA